jgi:hypothetical protein
MDIYWNIFTMHGSMNVKFANNTSKWQIEFNSEFKGLNTELNPICHLLALLRARPILHVSRIKVKTPDDGQ